MLTEDTLLNRDFSAKNTEIKSVSLSSILSDDALSLKSNADINLSEQKSSGQFVEGPNDDTSLATKNSQDTPEQPTENTGVVSEQESRNTTENQESTKDSINLIKTATTEPATEQTNKEIDTNETIRQADKPDDVRRDRTNTELSASVKPDTNKDQPSGAARQKAYEQSVRFRQLCDSLVGINSGYDFGPFQDHTFLFPLWNTKQYNNTLPNIYYNEVYADGSKTKCFYSGHHGLGSDSLPLHILVKLGRQNAEIYKCLTECYGPYSYIRHILKLIGQLPNEDQPMAVGWLKNNFDVILAFGKMLCEDNKVSERRNSEYVHIASIVENILKTINQESTSTTDCFIINQLLSQKLQGTANKELSDTDKSNILSTLAVCSSKIDKLDDKSKQNASVKRLVRAGLCSHDTYNTLRRILGAKDDVVEKSKMTKSLRIASAKLVTSRKANDRVPDAIVAKSELAAEQTFTNADLSHTNSDNFIPDSGKPNVDKVQIKVDLDNETVVSESAAVLTETKQSRKTRRKKNTFNLARSETILHEFKPDFSDTELYSKIIKDKNRLNTMIASLPLLKLDNNDPETFELTKEYIFDMTVDIADFLLYVYPNPEEIRRMRKYYFIKHKPVKSIDTIIVELYRFQSIQELLYCIIFNNKLPVELSVIKNELNYYLRLCNYVCESNGIKFLFNIMREYYFMEYGKQALWFEKLISYFCESNQKHLLECIKLIHKIEPAFTLVKKTVSELAEFKKIEYHSFGSILTRSKDLIDDYFQYETLLANFLLASQVHPAMFANFHIIKQYRNDIKQLALLQKESSTLYKKALYYLCVYDYLNVKMQSSINSLYHSAKISVELLETSDNM